jgi:hypothetical protein
MQWSYEAIETLLESADPDERPIIGGLCFGMSKGELYPTIYQFVALDGKLTTVRVRDYERDAVVQCAATGAAFILIHRRVLEAMRERAFNATYPWFQETELGGEPCGEDITFCIRAGICGFPIHVDTSVKIGHHKSNLLTEEMFLKEST